MLDQTATVRTVTLNQAEMKLARYIAESRQSNNRASHTVNQLRANADPLEKETLGIAGELAFCRLFNCYPDLTTVNRSKQYGQDSGDCYVAGIGWVDVKTKSQPGDLLIVTPTAPSGHWFAVMIGTPPTFYFAGAIPQVRALNQKYLREIRTGLHYVIPPADWFPDFKLPKV